MAPSPRSKSKASISERLAALTRRRDGKGGDGDQGPALQDQGRTMVIKPSNVASESAVTTTNKTISDRVAAVARRAGNNSAGPDLKDQVRSVVMEAISDDSTLPPPPISPSYETATPVAVAIGYCPQDQPSNIVNYYEENNNNVVVIGVRDGLSNDTPAETQETALNQNNNNDSRRTNDKKNQSFTACTFCRTTVYMLLAFLFTATIFVAGFCGSGKCNRPRSAVLSTDGEKDGNSKAPVSKYPLTSIRPTSMPVSTPTRNPTSASTLISTLRLTENPTVRPTETDAPSMMPTTTSPSTAKDMPASSPAKSSIPAQQETVGSTLVPVPPPIQPTRIPSTVLATAPPTATLADTSTEASPNPTQKELQVPTPARSPEPIQEGTSPANPTATPPKQSEEPSFLLTHDSTIDQNTILATAFQIDYAPVDREPNEFEFAFAGDVAMKHLEDFLIDQFLNTFSVQIVFFEGQILDTRVDPASTDFSVKIVFSQQSRFIPTTDDVDLLTELAFTEPNVAQLYSDLQTYPAQFPFSSVDSVTRTVLPDHM